MTTVKVPLFSPVYRNVDQVELSDQNYKLMDGYLDELGATVRRPGLSLFCDLGQGTDKNVDGLYWWDVQSCAIAVCNGQVFKLTYPGSTPTFENITDDALAVGSPCTFAAATDAAFTPFLIIANDGVPVYIEDTGDSTALSGAPTDVSQVAYLDGYVMAAEEDSNTVYFSGAYTPTTWASEYFSAAGDADVIKAITTFQSEIYLFGPRSTEIWENDGTNPFSRVPGGFIETGIIAPRSVVKAGQNIFWLDSTRRFVAWFNGKLTSISTPYDKEIATFSTIADARGMRLVVSGKEFLVWSFPTQARTLVARFNSRLDTTQSLVNDALFSWSEWGDYSPLLNSYGVYRGTCEAYCPPWGLQLVGGSRSRIYVVDNDTYTDTGSAIRLCRITGHINYGTTKTKRSSEFRIRAKRGQVVSGANPKVMVRWNDDNRGWRNEHWFDLGATGETETVMRLPRTGIFTTRQYEFVATDAADIIFLDAEEDVEVLR